MKWIIIFTRGSLRGTVIKIDFTYGCGITYKFDDINFGDSDLLFQRK